MQFFTTLAISFRFARHMRGWKFWLWPQFMTRFVRYQSVQEEMDALGMPDDEQAMLRKAWLYGEQSGYTEFPECQKCWIRFDPEMEVHGLKAVDGICVPCQELGDRTDFVECKRCKTLYDPEYTVDIKGTVVTAVDEVCASCLATDLLMEIEKTKPKPKQEKLR